MRAVSWPSCGLLPSPEYKHMGNVHPYNKLGPNLETLLWQTELTPRFKSVISWSKDPLKRAERFPLVFLTAGLGSCFSLTTAETISTWCAEPSKTRYFSPTDPEDSQITKTRIIWDFSPGMINTKSYRKSTKPHLKKNNYTYTIRQPDDYILTVMYNI